MGNKRRLTELGFVPILEGLLEIAFKDNTIKDRVFRARIFGGQGDENFW
jgi:hypothetical protein